MDGEYCQFKLLTYLKIKKKRAGLIKKRGNASKSKNVHKKYYADSTYNSGVAKRRNIHIVIAKYVLCVRI